MTRIARGSSRYDAVALKRGLGQDSRMASDFSEHSDQLRDQLRAFMSKKSLTVNGWAAKAGLTESTLRNFLSGRTETVTHLTLSQLARAAGISLSTLIGNVEYQTDPVPVSYIVEDKWKPYDRIAVEDTFGLALPLDPRFNHILRIGALIGDNSANRLFRVGSIVVCAPFAELERDLSHEDLVLCIENNIIVPKVDDGEMPDHISRVTIREVALYKNAVWLLSTTDPTTALEPIVLNPKHRMGDEQSPWNVSYHIGSPESPGWINIDALVVGSYRLEGSSPR